MPGENDKERGGEAPSLCSTCQGSDYQELQQAYPFTIQNLSLSSRKAELCGRTHIPVRPALGGKDIIEGCRC